MLSTALLLLFAALAGSAVSRKSPTADEPYHALAGWLHLWQHEYRLVSDHPPLWSTLGAAMTRPDDLKIDRKSLNALDLPGDSLGGMLWMIHTLFRTPGNDGLALVAKCRAVMLTVAVGMGALLAGFVWRLARTTGATAAAAGAATVFATALLALDPNFLAHSPLMKNDVASAFALLALTASTWAAGSALTVKRILTLGLCAGAATMVKWNGPLMIGSSALLLFIRAFAPWPWRIAIGPMAVRECLFRSQRVGVAAMTVCVMGIMTFGTIWAGYGFRFAPSPEPGVTMDVRGAVVECLERQWDLLHIDRPFTDRPSLQELYRMPQPLVVRACSWANDEHLLPQAFLAGLLFVFQSSLLRSTFLCGHISNQGTWWYFPFAMAVKTPVATIAACVSLVLACSAHIVQLAARRKTIVVTAEMRLGLWSALCLGLPVLVYLGAAMSANLNLGLRHVLPLYPLLFVAVGLGFARLWDTRKHAASLFASIIILSLAIENCAAYPNYIPFFNVFAGGSRGGLKLLSDSNLDWGQDLPLLADWQRHHPEQKLYLAYFGNTDPAFYGIRYTNVPEGYLAGPPAQRISEPGVLAISATTLQGTYCGQVAGQPTYTPLWTMRPFEVLGGSIYLFHVPLKQGDRLPPGQSLVE